MMVTRKPTCPSGSSSKKTNSHEGVQKDETPEEESPKEEWETNTEYERRRARVALRTGSPKPPVRLTLRTVKSKTPQTPPPAVRGPSRISRSPTRISLSSRSSIRCKSTTSSPEKRPWGAPTARLPAYHEQSISKRRRTTFDIPASEEASRTQQHGPLTRRYSLASLLALRPSSMFPERRRYAVPSYSEESEEIGHEENSFTSSYTLASGTSDQYQDHKPPPALREMYTCYGKPHLTGKSFGTSLGASKRYESSSTVNNEESYQGSPLTYRGRPRIIDTPTKSPTKDRTDDQAASVEDLESRIRSALSNRGRKNFGPSRKLRSVRWDPAILATCPGTPRHDTPENPEGVLETSQKVCLEGKSKSPETRLAQETDIADRKKQKKAFYDYMKRITELKKGDREKLLQLLEALKNLDSNDSSDTDTEVEKARRESKRAKNIQLKSKLNPTAAAFQDLSPVHAMDSPIKPALKVPRQHIILPNENHNSKEPVWVKREDLVLESRRLGVKAHRTENPPHPQVDVSQSSSANENLTRRILPAQGAPDATNLPQLPYFLPQAHFIPCPVPLVPVPPRRVQDVLTAPFANPPRENTRVNPKLPIIDLATGRIPNDDELGREAHVVPWGNLILERFQEKYPFTGNLRAEPPAPIKNTHAATIQQRLEYLLMEQKEKQARGEGLNERNSNIQGPKKVKTFYQAEKEAMRRLKAEIRKEDLEKKLREHNSSTTPLKMRVHTVPAAEERISEASTYVDSIYSVEGITAEGERNDQIF